MVREAEVKERRKHEEIKDSIVAFGRILGFFSEEEYRIGNRPLDVVWKRSQDIDPSHAFEVVVTKGLDTIERALIKLRTALMNWKGISICIVTTEEIKPKIGKLARTEHPEIAKVLTVLTLEELIQLNNKFKDISRTLSKMQITIRASKRVKKHAERVDGISKLNEDRPHDDVDAAKLES